MQFISAKEIVEDTQKGASQLFFEAGQSIIQLNAEEAKEYAVELIENRYSMSSLVNLADRTFSAVEEGDHKEKIRDYLSDVKKSKERVVDIAVEKLSSFERIGTLSYSSTVIEVLKNFEKVSVLESGPMCEGRTTAKELFEEGVDVDLYPDSSVYDFVKDVDAVLLGCDSLSGEGFTNKTGTYTLAIVCGYLDIPVYVVSDRSKFVPAEIPLPEGEEHDPKEVWDTDLDITIHNDYFEKIPWMDHIHPITDVSITE